MSIRHLRTFLSVARNGTLSAAAKEVGLTQAAVSIQMRALEEELRVQLFDRTRRAVVLNPAGRNLVPRAAEIVALYDDLAAAASGDGLAGLLTVGAIPPTFAQLLPDALLRLKQAHPRIDVRVVNGVSADLTLRVERGELDAALVAEPATRLPAQLSWHRVVSEPLVLLTAADDPVTSLRGVLAERPFIRVSRLAWSGRMLDNVIKRFDLRVHDVMELDSLDTIRAMVARGFGVSVLPMSESRWNDDPRVRIWPLVDPVINRDVGMIEREGTRRQRLTAALRECLMPVPGARPPRRHGLRSLRGLRWT